jgi:hypothetical protein
VDRKPAISVVAAQPAPGTEAPGKESPAALVRYCERRSHIRVPASGHARWQSGTHRGYCELLDVSPGGVGLRMPARRALQLGPLISIEIELTPGRRWCLTKDARVVRRIPDQDGTCAVGVQFVATPS